MSCEGKQGMEVTDEGGGEKKPWHRSKYKRYEVYCEGRKEEDKWIPYIVRVSKSDDWNDSETIDCRDPRKKFPTKAAVLCYLGRVARKHIDEGKNEGQEPEPDITRCRFGRVPEKLGPMGEKVWECSQLRKPFILQEGIWRETGLDGAKSDRTCPCDFYDVRRDQR